MFDTLADKLQAALGDVSGRKRLDEETISKAMREIRLALLEADVNFTVVKEFVAGVRERALGEEVTKSLSAGQQVVKIVHEQLGRQIQIPVHRQDSSDPVEVVRTGLQRFREEGRDVVILDTAGRLHVDEPLMEELAAIRDVAKPHNVLLVLDAMTGQEAVNVAQAFQERIAFDGVVLTKLDGDARGGAALSVRAVTGKPVKFMSVGEKLDQLEDFHPDRMASRILGMGDVLTLIEKAEAAASEDEQAELEKRVLAGQFTFDDFLAAQKMLKRMGPIQGVLKMLPGVGNQLKDVDIDERQLARVEAIVLSMTPQERRTPHLINGSRRQRIARGSGVTVDEVTRLLSARKQMEKLMGKMRKGGNLADLMPQAADGTGAATPAPRRSKAASKRKRSRR